MATARAEKDSQTAGKSASKLAWMLDEREEERARGITIDVGMKRIVTPKRTIVLFDCPGHKDFVDNMMIGAAQVIFIKY
jgi:elongation factor 1 alpha-like protein